jgi:flagellar basal body rod protein FlgC
MINILPGIQSTTAALAAERTRMDVISENIANAHTTRGIDGKPYERKTVVFETALKQAMDIARHNWFMNRAIPMPIRMAWSQCRTSTFTRKWRT